MEPVTQTERSAVVPSGVLAHVSPPSDERKTLPTFPTAHTLTPFDEKTFSKPSPYVNAVRRKKRKPREEKCFMVFLSD
jgi:hypothetical protein